MEQQQLDVQTVFIKDLLFAALYQWRKILIAALVLALLAGGFAVLFPKEDTDLEDRNMMLSKIEWYEQLIVSSNKLIQEQTNYIEHSPLMKIDPYETYTAGVYIFIIPEDATSPVYEEQIYNTTPAILRHYQSCLTDPQTIDPIAKELGMESLYLRELITFDNSGSALGITVRGSSEQQAQDIANRLTASIESIQPDASANVSKHEIDIHPFTVGPKMDNSLYDHQNGARKRIDSLQETIQNATDSIKALNNSIDTRRQMSPGLIAALGGVVGAGIIVCIAWASHISCKKVYSARVLKNVTGMRVLCTVVGPKKRFIVDRWLRKLEGRSDSTEQLPAVAAVIKNQCAGKLLVIGQSTDAQRAPVLEALKNEGVDYISHSTLLSGTDAIHDLQSCAAIVLTETCGLSAYEQIRYITERANDEKKPLLGCILIDG